MTLHLNGLIVENCTEKSKHTQKVIQKRNKNSRSKTQRKINN